MQNHRVTFAARPGLGALIATAMLLLSAPPAGANGIRFWYQPIWSDGSWLVTSTKPAGDWTLPGFDDSGWRSAFAPYPNPVTTPNDILPGSNAKLIWDPTVPVKPDGKPDESWFRYEFQVKPASSPYQCSPPSDAPDDCLDIWNGESFSFRSPSATTYVVADDRFDLYVNGVSVASNVALEVGPDGQPTNVHAYDLKPHLLYLDAFGNPVDNVIAIHAWDGPGDTAEENLYQYLFVDGVITDAVRLIPDLTLYEIEEAGDTYSKTVFRFTVAKHPWRLESFQPCFGFEPGFEPVCGDFDVPRGPPVDQFDGITWGEVAVVPCPDDATATRECFRYIGFAGPGEHYLNPVGSFPGRSIRASVVPEPGSLLLIALAIGLVACVGARKTSRRSC